MTRAKDVGEWLHTLLVQPGMTGDLGARAPDDVPAVAALFQQEGELTVAALLALPPGQFNAAREALRRFHVACLLEPRARLPDGLLDGCGTAVIGRRMRAHIAGNTAAFPRTCG